jgi:hypothetical protein
MSVSPRRPPPSPYASMSLQSASSADGSGPLDGAAGGLGPLSAQAFLPGALRPAAATVLEEGRSGSLEARDRAVSFENWKVKLYPSLCLRCVSPTRNTDAWW